MVAFGRLLLPRGEILALASKEQGEIRPFFYTVMAPSFEDAPSLRLSLTEEDGVYKQGEKKKERWGFD